ncbi:MAG: 23S rRNA (pseudouridine(1915)-N(3))-methyltransferase RlmH, partial [Deltaproteobacteria bacterium]|nr:23S rRNA (pseudouridine(1915)-N(3))-methyltransferase RlmH [Deltaproteobacteria bacterium]
MNIEVLAVGRPRTRFVAQALTHYLNHLKGLAPMTITPLKPEPILQGSSPPQIRRAEADRILSRLKAGSLTVVLDQSGEPLSSEELTGFMGRWQQSGKNR